MPIPASLPKHVLIISSNEATIEDCRATLHALNPEHKLSAFSNGYDALDFIQAKFKYRENMNGHYGVFPHLFLVDVKISGMDIYDFIHSYNAHFSIRDFWVPMYLVTHDASVKFPAFNKVYPALKGILEAPLNDKGVLDNALKAQPYKSKTKPWFKFW